MRHLIKGKKLGRTTSHRKATMQALSVALIQHERIKTTLAKAKNLRLYVEPVITKSKKDTPHNRKLAFSFLRDKAAVTKLFDEIGELVSDRPGGYTRIIKIGKRAGDNADMAVIELVDYNDEKPEKPGKKKKRTRRAGRGKASDTAAAKPEVTENKPAEEISEEAEAKEKADVQSDEIKADNATDAVSPEAEAPEAVEDKQESEQTEKPKETSKKKESGAKDPKDDSSESNKKD